VNEFAALHCDFIPSHITFAFSSQLTPPSLLLKPAVSAQVAKGSKKNSKATHAQRENTEAAGAKQPTAAEVSFYTGRGVQPRKTIDGLPVFSLAEMVYFIHHQHHVLC
jgi:hypothetical protein